MWPKFYKDYPVDSPSKKERVEPGKGIIGCEMHEDYGWGESFHIQQKRKGAFWRALKRALSPRKSK